ncbi:MAG: hypothetical protein K0M58_02735 [Thiobacillus sp.]|nr:hypothetical protein [Thiobacillus sp.]
MTGNHRFIPLRALALAALYTVAANAQAANADVYRETYPRVAIDPAQGVAGAGRITSMVSLLTLKQVGNRPTQGKKCRDSPAQELGSTPATKADV